VRDASLVDPGPLNGADHYVRPADERERAKEGDMLSIERLMDWLRVGEYQRAKDQADADIRARQSRGNTMSQDGASGMTEQDLRAASEEADQQMAWLDKKIDA